MTRRTEMYCALSSIVGIVILLVGIWPIAGLLPVPSPNYGDLKDPVQAVLERGLSFWKPEA